MRSASTTLGYYATGCFLVTLCAGFFDSQYKNSYKGYSYVSAGGSSRSLNVEVSIRDNYIHTNKDGKQTIGEYMHFRFSDRDAYLEEKLDAITWSKVKNGWERLLPINTKDLDKDFYCSVGKLSDKVWKEEGRELSLSGDDWMCSRIIIDRKNTTQFELTLYKDNIPFTADMTFDGERGFIINYLQETRG
jgi:hypothetical protein